MLESSSAHSPTIVESSSAHSSTMLESSSAHLPTMPLSLSHAFFRCKFVLNLNKERHLGIFGNYKYNLCSHSLNSHPTRHDLCFVQYRGQLRGVTDTRGSFRNRCLSEWLKTILGQCSLVMRTQLVSVMRVSNHQPSHQARIAWPPKLGLDFTMQRTRPLTTF